MITRGLDKVPGPASADSESAGASARLTEAAQVKHSSGQTAQKDHTSLNNRCKAVKHSLLGCPRGNSNTNIETEYKACSEQQRDFTSKKTPFTELK